MNKELLKIFRLIHSQTRNNVTMCSKIQAFKYTKKSSAPINVFVVWKFMAFIHLPSWHFEIKIYKFNNLFSLLSFFLFLSSQTTTALPLANTRKMNSNYIIFSFYFCFSSGLCLQVYCVQDVFLFDFGATCYLLKKESKVFKFKYKLERSKWKL